MRLRLIILLACTHLIASGQTTKDTALSFFPHAIGDYWVYSHAAAYMTSGLLYQFRVDVVQRTSMPNGHEYALFQTTNLSSNDRDTVYRRVDSSSAVIWQYNPSTNSEFVEDSLLSTRYEWFPGHVIQVTTLIRSYSVPYLAQRWGSAAGLIYTWWHELGFPYVDSLVFAEVGGIVFGNINAVRQERAFPSEFQVSAPYPNPFNSRTSIRVSLARAARIHVAVVDQIGRFVELVADREFEAGEVVLGWEAGQQSSGVYYFRVVTPEGIRVQPTILVR